MPIGQKEWDAGSILPELMESRILDFLQKNKGKAYTMTEIGEEVGVYMKPPIGSSGWRILIDSFVTTTELSGFLGTLVKEGKIESKSIKERGTYVTYYRVV